MILICIFFTPTDALNTETTTPRPAPCPHEIELHGGLLINEGNLFIYGKPVCDGQWDTHDAVVACRMLGYFFLILFIVDII